MEAISWKPNRAQRRSRISWPELAMRERRTNDRYLKRMAKRGYSRHSAHVRGLPKTDLGFSWIDVVTRSQKAS